MSKLLILLLLLCPLGGMAQGKFTDNLKRKSAAGGVVVLHEDAEIENLVNGGSTATAKTTATPKTSRDSVRTTAPVTTADSAESAEKEPARNFGPHTKGTGYRVQICLAGNTKKDKAEAERWGRLFKAYYTDYNVYIAFSSPHWTCRVGDFKSREDAVALLEEMKATQAFKTASVVKSKINIYY